MARILFFIVILLLVAWLIRQLINAYQEQKNKRLATLIGEDFDDLQPPYHYQKKYLLNSRKLDFFQNLQQRLPNLVILPQLALHSVLASNEINAERNKRAFLSIANEFIELAVFDGNFNLVCVIEFTEQNKQTEHEKYRAQILQSVDVATISFTPNDVIDFEQIATDITNLLK